MNNIGETIRIPLSFAQERLYFLDKVSQHNSLYSVPYRLSFTGNIDVAALEGAFRALIARHEILRTCFFEEDGEPFQCIQQEMSFKLEYENISDIEDQSNILEHLVHDFSCRPYQLQYGPLLRAKVLCLGVEHHVLLLGLHHIVFDGWSSQVMANELDRLYVAIRDAGEALLDELPVQYADFAQWQRKRYEDGEFVADVQYWKDALTDVPALLNLATDRPRPPIPSYKGDSLEVDLPEDIASELLQLSRTLGVTPFILFAATVNVLLAHYSGQTDISIGFPVAGRGHPDLERIIGFFSNTLVLRTLLNRRHNFADVVELVRSNLLDALEHSELPFDKLVEELAPTRSLAWNPLFQVCVTDQVKEDHWRLGDCSAESVVFSNVGVSKFDLTFFFIRLEAGIKIRLEYSTDLFECAKIRRMSLNLLELFRSIVATPDVSVLDLRFITDEEECDLRRMGEGECAEIPNKGLAELFQEQVHLHPNAVAVRTSDTAISYFELDLAANRIAHVLHGYGVVHETPIAIIAGTGVEKIIGLLGILKAGGCYVPLDPRYPEDRLRFMIEDCGAKIVVGEKNYFDTRGKWIDAKLKVEIDTLCANPFGIDNLRPIWGGALGSSLAYIMYTSGSTGQPKGVSICQNSVTRLVFSNPFLPFEKSLTFAQVSNFSFDAATLEIWGALLHGGTLVLFEELQNFEPENFEHFLKENSIQALFLTSALFSQLAVQKPSMFSSIEYLVFGGGRADINALRILRQHGFSGNLINGYGPTETTTFACTHSAYDQDLVQSDLPIGRPISNTEVFILTPAMSLSPIGVIGELYIGGLGLARGYFNAPTMTAERFVPNPFSSAPGSRLYRTGDLCFWREDNTVAFVSRADDQIKIDGFRIEPEEIRLNILKYPTVIQAIVYAESKSDGSGWLKAYVVFSDKSSESSIGQLRIFLKSKLPGYMVPASLISVKSIPLTENGKVDIRELRLQANSEGERQIAHELLSGLGKRFLSIVFEILGLETVDIECNFFDIGGTSLHALRLMSNCRRKLGRELPISSIFQSNSLRDLIHFIESLPKIREEDAIPSHRSCDNVSDVSRHPLSFAQESLYFFDKISPNSSLYSVPYRLNFKGAIDVEALKRAFSVLIARHEILRTVFSEDGGVPFQRIDTKSEFKFEYEDISNLPEQENTLERIVSTFLDRPYDLNSGPLLRAKLLCLGPEHNVLLVGLHHIIFDGWSSQVMIRELNELYVTMQENGEVQLRPLPVQYADFAKWQRSRYECGEFSSDSAFWKATLKDAPELLSLPTDWPRPAFLSYAGSSLKLHFPEDVARDLLELARKLGATPFVLFTATVNILLVQYSSQMDISIGFPVVGRGHPDLDESIGCFSNTLILRTLLNRQQSFRDVVELTSNNLLEALEHSELPFDKLVEELAPTRSLAWNPLFQVCVTDQVREDSWRLGDLIGLNQEFPTTTSKFDLSFNFEHDKNGVTVHIEYSTDLFVLGTVRAMADLLGNLLKDFIRDPEKNALRVEPIGIASQRQSFRKFR